MIRPLIRVDDTTSHGGKVLEGSENMIVDGKPVACDGDRTACGATLKATQDHYLIQ